MNLDVWFDVPTHTWVAWDDATEVIGYGQSRDEAVADYRDNLGEHYVRLCDLGHDKVSARLWATLPTLRKALGIA